MKQWIFFCAMVLVMASCNKAKFTIEGDVAGADGQTLYLELLTSGFPRIIDSVKLDADGEFKFKYDAPRFPEIYQLRLGGATVHLAIDSIETLHFSSTAQQFASAYTLTGSDKCEKMQIVAQEGARLKASFNRFEQAAINKSGNKEELGEQFDADLAEYKEKMFKIILENPASIVSYYIVYQEINGKRIFDIQESRDGKLIAAVATGFELKYPTSSRTKQLKEMALQGLALERARRNPAELEAIESTLLDIELYDHLGQKQVLSQLAKTGKVILLDFTQYQTQDGPFYNMELGKMYEKYADKGVEIYQVSLDLDEYNWRISAGNLPWICVRDPQGLQSKYLTMYNVQVLPTCFIIDRTGGIVKRVENIADIEKDILTYL